MGIQECQLLPMTSPTFISCLLALGLAGVHPQPRLSGEAVCEGSKLSQAACVALSCCEWDGQDCHARSPPVACPATTTTAKPVTAAATTNTDTKAVCEGSKLSQAACVALSCCEWDGQDCHSRSPPVECKVTWTLKTSPFPQFPKYTTVFGAPVFAASSVTDAQFQHVASVFAEWLDNDEDGCVDNPLALTKYLAKKPQPAIL